MPMDFPRPNGTTFVSLYGGLWRQIIANGDAECHLSQRHGWVYQFIMLIHEAYGIRIELCSRGKRYTVKSSRCSCSVPTKKTGIIQHAKHITMSCVHQASGGKTGISHVRYKHGWRILVEGIINLPSSVNL